MQAPKTRVSLIENTLILGLFILLIFSSPLLEWWASPTNAWYLPYLIWLGIILLIAWIQHRHHGP
jgi:hypothetical protein